jgi:arylformamidase
MKQAGSREDPGVSHVPAGDLVDISIPVHPGTPAWPGDTPFSCNWTWAMARGDSVNVSCTNGSPHVGTHADAPFHVDSSGATSESIPLTAFVGPAEMIDVRGHDGPIERGDLPGHAIRGGRLLLRTGQSIARGSFPDRWPWLTPACIAELARDGLRLVGVDSPSVDARDSKDLATHRAIFAQGGAILENLDLSGVEPGAYELVAAPMRVVGLDAAPVRAALRRLPAR